MGPGGLLVLLGRGYQAVAGVEELEGVVIVGLIDFGPVSPGDKGANSEPPDLTILTEYSVFW